MILFVCFFLSGCLFALFVVFLGWFVCFFFIIIFHVCSFLFSLNALARSLLNTELCMFLCGSAVMASRLALCRLPTEGLETPVEGHTSI